MTILPAAPVRTTTDPAALILLAQPMRLRIDAQLRHGPASSSTLALVLGESIDLTNYHLQQMTEHGFIEEIPELSEGRKRWWRSAHKQLIFPPREEQTPEMRALIDEMNRINFAADLDDLMRSQLEQEESEIWLRSLPYSRGVIHVTSGELAEFFEEYTRLLSRYERSPEDTPPEARAVLTRFMAFPAPAPPVPEQK